MNNRNIVLAGFAAVAILIIAVLWWLITPSWIALYPNPLSNSAQQMVLQQLGVNGYEYKLDSKNIILVKSDDFTGIQKFLDAKGLPEKGNTGLEIFANSDYGLSDFAQNINYQRGMEEELSRTIKKIKGIKDARVHLTIKKDSLFEDRKQKPKASVVVSPFSGESLSHQNIKSIQEIVAAAVANLDPASVVVITDDGIILSSSDDAASSVEGAQSLEAKYVSQINDLLILILPKNSFKVSVNIFIEQKKKVTIEENYFPDLSTGKGFLVKKRSSENDVYNQNSPSEKSLNKTSEEEYVFSKERSEIVYPDKEIKKISVGLVITQDISVDKLKNIEALIFSSLGMDTQRGDSVVSYFSNQAQENISSLPILYEEKYENRPQNFEEKNYINHFNLSSNSVFIFMIVFFISSIVFMILLLASKKNASRSMSEGELDKLANNIKAWTNNR